MTTKIETTGILIHEIVLRSRDWPADWLEKFNGAELLEVTLYAGKGREKLIVRHVEGPEPTIVTLEITS